MTASFRNGLFLVLLCGSLRAGTVFDFDSDTVGTSTAFTDTVGGLSVTFSSPSDPGGFGVGPTFFSTLTGNVLFDPGPAATDIIPLTLTFNSSLSDISLLFATNSEGPVPFVLNAYLGGVGGTFVGSTSASGTIPLDGLFPEGSISFGGAVFDTIVLSSTATDFAIDNVDATVSGVPEPAAWGTIGLGLGLLGLYQRRTRSRL